MMKKLFCVAVLIINAFVLTGCVTDNEVSDTVVGNNAGVFIYSPVKIKKVVSGATEANPIDTRYDYSYGLAIGQGCENLEVPFTIIDFYDNEYEFTFYYTRE